VTVEEPTGLYRRLDEVARVPLAKLGNNSDGFQVVDARGRELPWQAAGGELLFPASAVPGELPAYFISCCKPAGARFTGSILARRTGMNRVELGNDRFRAVIDLKAAAIVELYNLSAGPHRVVNLVETTPEDAAALKEDIHLSSGAPGFPDTGVPGPNIGLTSLGGSGELTRVDFLETGPLRGRIRLGRPGETWELEWAAGGTWLKWRAGKGFRFASVSASPYLPFDRFAGGSEYEWPSGPEAGEPPDSRIAARPWKRLPGGHVVYYGQAENYGAMGVVALDGALEWTGVGSRRFEASKSGGPAEIALTFPRWRGNSTVLDARKENRCLRQPLLVRVEGQGAAPAVRTPAPRDPVVKQELGSFRPHLFEPRVVELDGAWELAWGEKGAGPTSEWREVRVPGSAHTQWLPSSKIYTREANWVSGKEWWYRKRFTAPREFAGKRLRLQFEATDYYADAWLNGRLLGRHEGYIDPYEYEVTTQIRPAESNELLVRVWTPVSYYWKHRPYTIKGSYGAVDQKPDDITALGITRSVRLVASPKTGGDPYIRDVSVDTRLVGQGAEVVVEVVTAGRVRRCELTLRPRNFASPAAYRLRGPGSRFTFRLEKPELWWTWDHGRPNLYTLDVSLRGSAGDVVDRKSMAVGIREIEKIGWNFYLNRRRLWIRGTNSYYHLFLSEMRKEDYERDFGLIRGMNVNMIRLHCHFSNREFYELADETGMLIWQDYLEAWYPHDTAFSLRAAKLYDAHIRYVRHHPSVAIWAASDEEDLENYRDLTKHLAARPALLDPQRRAVIRSTGRYGDSHVYYGWYGGSIWQYTSLEDVFVSELGATALPNYESLQRFLPGKWPIREHVEDWVFHKLQIPEAMRAWGEPGGLRLEEYIARTQRYVALLHQLAIERMRRNKSRTGGILHFHAVDIWPSVTMAAIDFFRTPTKAYEAVRRSFQPVVASVEFERNVWRSGDRIQLPLWLVNDTWDRVCPAEVRWELRDEAGSRKESGTVPGCVAADGSARLGEIGWRAAEAGEYLLVLAVQGSGGETISENRVELAVLPR
jgi:beta-mannosidase